MDYFTLDNGQARLSRVILGGHEYLPSGASRGFNEDFALAVTPGEIFPGFGGDGRRAVLEAAYDLGINVFDVTIDAEKEALGRNLAEMPPPYEVFVQTRPEGMCYGYDLGNRRMADLTQLRAEVQRCLKLLRRERLDILNLGILRDARDQDPDFLDKLATNIVALKREGLIRFAAADTFSGEATFLAMIATGAFASINLNFNIAEDFAEQAVIPAARAKGMAVVAREVFMKGGLFPLGAEAGIADKALLARSAMRWTAARPGIDAVIVGADTPAHLRVNAAAILAPRPDEAEEAALAALRATPGFIDHRRRKAAEFGAAAATN